MIRSSSHSLRYTNPGKRATVNLLVAEYSRFAQVLVDDIWVGGFRVNPRKNQLDFKGASLLPTEDLKTHGTWLSARMQQAAGKQAVMMVKSATETRKRQLWVLAKLQETSGKFKTLQSKIDRQPLVKPDTSQINLELDSRFVDFQNAKSGGFSFVRLSSIGQEFQVKIPVQNTRVSGKWSHRWVVRLSEEEGFRFKEVPNEFRSQRCSVCGWVRKSNRKGKTCAGPATSLQMRMQMRLPTWLLISMRFPGGCEGVE